MMQRLLSSKVLRRLSMTFGRLGLDGIRFEQLKWEWNRCRDKILMATPNNTTLQGVDTLRVD
jgi:hypothetical protein